MSIHSIYQNLLGKIVIVQDIPSEQDALVDNLSQRLLNELSNDELAQLQRISQAALNGSSEAFIMKANRILYNLVNNTQRFKSDTDRLNSAKEAALTGEYDKARTLLDAISHPALSSQAKSFKVTLPVTYQQLKNALAGKTFQEASAAISLYAKQIAYLSETDIKRILEAAEQDTSTPLLTFLLTKTVSDIYRRQNDFQKFYKADELIGTGDTKDALSLLQQIQDPILCAQIQHLIPQLQDIISDESDYDEEEEEAIEQDDRVSRGFAEDTPGDPEQINQAISQGASQSQSTAQQAVEGPPSEKEEPPAKSCVVS